VARLDREVTLNMTSGGSIFDGWKYFARISGDSGKDEFVCDRLSSKVARSASGETTAFQRFEGPTWLRFELPALKKNTAITEIKIQRVE
jgi:hypothetical protein